MGNVMDTINEKQLSKLHSTTLKAFTVHFPDYEIKTFKAVYAPRYFYIVPQNSKDDFREYVCQLDSIEAVNGFLYGALKAITGAMIHNESWKEDLILESRMIRNEQVEV